MAMVCKMCIRDRFAGCYNVGPDDCDCVTTGELADLFCRYWGGRASWRSEPDGGPHEANFLKLDLSLIHILAYYQIGQLYGMMETFALWGALGIFYGLYVYLNEEREWGLKLSLILYFLTCFVHERYMVLIVVIFLALAMKLERRIML